MGDATADWWDNEDLAARWRTTVPAVRALRYRGEGPPATKIGRRILYRPADVRKWEKDKEREQAPRVPVPA